MREAIEEWERAVNKLRNITDEKQGRQERQDERREEHDAAVHAHSR